MELTTGINQVMAYTEQCLKDELNTEKIAQLCGCSYTDFQRIFSLLNNMSYLEYVKARRLSQAAVEIIHSRKKFWILHWNMDMRAGMYLRQRFAEPLAVHLAGQEKRMRSCSCLCPEPLTSPFMGIMT